MFSSSNQVFVEGAKGDLDLLFGEVYFLGNSCPKLTAWWFAFMKKILTVQRGCAGAPLAVQELRPTTKGYTRNRANQTSTPSLVVAAMDFAVKKPFEFPCS